MILSRGDRHYAVMVGLMEHGVPIMGWVYAPESDRLYFMAARRSVVYIIQDGDAEAESSSVASTWSPVLQNYHQPQRQAPLWRVRA
jgi:3'-phosphoadenosine 5'-phosphosulfate (PAPS) 3'-phosphatase